MKTIVTDIPDYKTFLKGQKTLEIGYPWLTFGAIMALEKILSDSKGKFSILESGCGGSTLFFYKRCESLMSYEHNMEWLDKIKEKIGFISDNHILVDGYEGIENLVTGSFDIVLVDGGKDWRERQWLLDISLSKVRKGGWLIIDNYEHLKFDYTGWDVYTFDMFRYSGRGTRLCKKL